MTKAQRWHDQVCANAHGVCEAYEHDPRCRGIGQHAHHIHYKAHIPQACYWVVENGIWLSLLCHVFAHTTHNENLPARRRRAASVAIRASIAKAFPDKPELLPPLFEEAA